MNKVIDMTTNMRVEEDKLKIQNKMDEYKKKKVPTAYIQEVIEYIIDINQGDMDINNLLAIATILTQLYELEIKVLYVTDTPPQITAKFINNFIN